MPPTKPTLPLFETSAAAIPQRNDDSCSRKLIDCTFGRATTASMIVNFTSGNCFATFSTAEACVKPTATMMLAPRFASCAIACSRWAALVISNSRKATPVSFWNFAAPSAADWLNERSNLPPKS